MPKQAIIHCSCGEEYIAWVYRMNIGDTYIEKTDAKCSECGKQYEKERPEPIGMRHVYVED